jgi:hypothetical protein
VGIDPTKTFVKKNPELIPAGESVLAAVVAEVRAGRGAEACARRVR